MRYHLKEVFQFVDQSFVTIGEPDVGHIRSCNVVAHWAVPHALRPHPELFHLKRGFLNISPVVQDSEGFWTAQGEAQRSVPFLSKHPAPR